MRIPSRGKTEIYDLSKTHYASVKLEDSNKFWVTISRIEKPVLGEDIIVTVQDANDLWLDTFDEVREYLLEKAEGKYKEQFQD